ncbi:hypothetical protein [Salinicoccus roseus]|uniref:hypothetical protein n=1 Tax=Salinicoccus roseus TaxID=45670 RepID=UPI0023016AA6|nr:hypothetical protein [Salinicoccus roseus]
MRREKDEVYLVVLNGYYVKGDFLSIGSIHLTKDKTEAHTFTSLKWAVKHAKELRGEVMFYGHRRTEYHDFNDLYSFEVYEE